MNRAINAVGIALFTVGLWAAPPSTAYAVPYYGYDKGGDGNVHDATKDWQGDCLLCWAAAASNILDWAGWGVDGLRTETEIFENFEQHWTDEGSYAAYAWYWWFTGEVIDPGDTWASVDVPGGGNHWGSRNFLDYLYMETAPALAMHAVDSYLHQRRGVTIGVYPDEGPGHALTIWGYEYGDTQDDYLGLWFTDSDDAEGLLYIGVQFDDDKDLWKLVDDKEKKSYLHNFHIEYVHALATIPEASSLALTFASGIGMFLMVRRQRRSRIA